MGAQSLDNLEPLWDIQREDKKPHSIKRWYLSYCHGWCIWHIERQELPLISICRVFFINMMHHTSFRFLAIVVYGFSSNMASLQKFNQLPGSQYSPPKCFLILVIQKYAERSLHVILCDIYLCSCQGSSCITSAMAIIYLVERTLFSKRVPCSVAFLLFQLHAEWQYRLSTEHIHSLCRE